MAQQSSSAPAEQRPRRYSYLLDQEYQRRKDEEAAEAATISGKLYKPGVKDCLLFAYFCTNVFFVGNAMLNANALVRSWKSSETFRSECASVDDPNEWCPAQAESAKVALLLYQSFFAATGLLSGVLVDAFSAPMCLLIAHLLYGMSAHFLKSAATRETFLSCVLQGIAGELLLGSVIPVCGLFSKHQDWMLFILTLFSDLSVLFYPIISTFFAPTTALTATKAEFYGSLYQYMVYYAIVAGVVGIFILPIDDEGQLIPVTAPAKAAIVEPGHFVVPKGVLSSPVEHRLPRLNRDEDDDLVFRNVHVEGEEDEMLLLHQELAANSSGSGGYKEMKSLWELRFSRQLRTIQFVICCLLFGICIMRNSFYLNNNESLLQAAGDDGSLSQAFMWLLGLGAIFGPISWYFNDNCPEMINLCLLATVGLAVNLLVLVTKTNVQWLTMILFIASRSALSSTLLTLIAQYFGFQHFPEMVIVVSLFGAFFNFLSYPMDQYIEKNLDGDYQYGNYVMIALGAVVLFLILLHYLFPTLRGESTSRQGHGAEELKKAVEPLSEGIQQRARRTSITKESAPQSRDNKIVQERKVDLEDEWEDINDSRARL